MILPALTLVGVSRDGFTVTLKDSTGAYNVTTNPGGYGTPNGTLTAAGVIPRYWPDDLPYARWASADDTNVLQPLQGGGYGFTLQQITGVAGRFASGVHHFKYYPFENGKIASTVTQDSTLVTLAGTDTRLLLTSYKAVVFLNSSNIVVGKPFLIDRTQTVANNSFHLDQAWPDATTSSLGYLLATEADLKILVTAGADECLTQKIGRLGSMHHCDNGRIEELTRLTQWKFAADLKMQCLDYTGAHNMIVAVESECRSCDLSVGTCKTCR